MSFSKAAILVDGDNVPASFAGQILRKAKSLGTAQVRRVYGTTNSIASWSSAASFKPIAVGGSKNGADILLSIEAIKFALRDGIEAFAIVSSDRDFSHASHTLRELGFHVLGLGESKAPNEFRLSCSEFDELEPPKVKTSTESLPKLDRTIRAALEQAGKKGILVTQLNGIMRIKHEVKISDQPEKKWKPYLANRPELYTITGEGQTARVHIATEA